MAGIRLEGLRKVYGDDGSGVLAVDDVNLDIEDGEFVILVGPSGCGKTTILRCIGGLEAVTDGEIHFDNQAVTDKDPKDRNVAMVFQNYALYPHMTARENMSFSLKYSTELGNDEIYQRVEEAAQMMDIDDLLDKKPGELSGGQQQRVALGRAIVREPDVFLMDEPLSNLDAKLRTTMRTELQELHEKLDITTIYVTHDQEEAMTMGDRIAIMNDGKLQQVGAPLECYHQPVNRFVASFIGSPSMNFFDVELHGDRLEHSEFTYTLSAALSEQLESSSQSLVLGIRPEDVTVQNATTENSIRVEATVIEPMGELTHVYVDIGDVPCTVTITGDVDVQPGSMFHIEFPEDRLHLFDRQTGTTIKNRDIAPDRLVTASSTTEEMSL